MAHQVVLYKKEGCCLCDKALEVLHRLQRDFDLRIQEVDITTDPDLFQRYRYTIPVAVVDGRYTFESKIAEYHIRKVLK